MYPDLEKSLYVWEIIILGLLYYWIQQTCHLSDDDLSDGRLQVLQSELENHTPLNLLVETQTKYYWTPFLCDDVLSLWSILTIFSSFYGSRYDHYFVIIHVYTLEAFLWKESFGLLLHTGSTGYPSLSNNVVLRRSLSFFSFTPLTLMNKYSHFILSIFH